LTFAGGDSSQINHSQSLKKSKKKKKIIIRHSFGKKKKLIEKDENDVITDLVGLPLFPGNFQQNRGVPPEKKID